MSKRNTYNEILDRLISGSLTEKERFEIEKKALDDPMLFDAIEGISSIPGTHHHEHIEAIKNRIYVSKGKRKTRKFLIPIAVAASIILIFSVGNIFFNQDLPSTDQGSLVFNESEDVSSPDGDDNVIAGAEEVSKITRETPNESTEIEKKVPPPATETYQKTEEVVVEKSDDIVGILEAEESIAEEIVQDMQANDIAAIIPVEEGVTLEENEPLSKKKAARKPLSTTENSFTNPPSSPLTALKVELPLVDRSLNSFLKESYEDSYEALPLTIKIEMGIIFDDLLMAKDVRIISGDKVIGNRLIPFIKEYRDWSINQPDSDKEIQFVFFTDK